MFFIDPSNILITISLLPIIGSLFLLTIPDNRIDLIKQSGLLISCITFILSLVLWIDFDKSSFTFQFVKKLSWIDSSNFYCYIGLDGISLFFVLLTTFLTPICILANWNHFPNRIKDYIIAFLVLETFMINVFCVMDLVLFYVFFESVLIPMFLIIGVWGSRARKIYAAYQLVVYTLFGSVFMLLAILVIYLQVGSTDYHVLLNAEFKGVKQIFLWLAFFIGFAIKMPMLPFHIWLPEAHVEAPTAGSVILAGILLKLGSYGFIRFSLTMFPEASVYFAPMMYTLGLLAVVYTSMTTIRQIDLKKIIAYSSVAHMGFVTLGIFSFNSYGLEGSIFIMISHGIVSSALFLCIGVVYDKYKTRVYKYYSNIVQLMPIYVTMLFVFILANLSLPGTASFIGEFLTLLGIVHINSVAAILLAIGAILGAVYSIWLFNRVSFGNPNVTYLTNLEDLNLREFSYLTPLLILTILLGIYPELVLDYVHASSTYILL